MNLCDEVAAVDGMVAAEAMHLVVTAAYDSVVVDVLNLLVGEDCVHGSHVSSRVFVLRARVNSNTYVNTYFNFLLNGYGVFRITLKNFLWFFVFYDVYGFFRFVVFICFLRRVADGMWGTCCVVRS